MDEAPPESSGLIRRPARDRLRAWPTPSRLVLLGIVLVFLAIDIRMTIAVLDAQPLAIDWSPLWTAARLPASDAASLYDFARITNAQAALIGAGTNMRPFVYPPSALIAFLPFALLPVLPSCWAWLAGTGAAYLAAASRLAGEWWLLPLLPPVVLAALVGQTGFLLGSLILLGLHLLDGRPGWAGIVLGIATAIKPQILILVPLALIVAQNWRALACWVAGGAGMVLLSLALYGAGAWIDWFAALPRFQALIAGNSTLRANAITPYALAQSYGCAGWWVFAAAAPIASAGILGTFRAGGATSDRLVALVGGALLVSPYAMNYELILIAPALVSGVSRDVRKAALLLVVAVGFFLGFGFWSLAIAMLATAARRSRPCA